MDFAGNNPWSRLPTPTDYVSPMVFLASDESTLMTGSSNITIDGGALAKYWPQAPRRQWLETRSDRAPGTGEVSARHAQ